MMSIILPFDSCRLADLKDFKKVNEIYAKCESCSSDLLILMFASHRLPFALSMAKIVVVSRQVLESHKLLHFVYKILLAFPIGLNC